MEEGAFVFETPSKISAFAFASLSFLSAKYYKTKQNNAESLKLRAITVDSQETPLTSCNFSTGLAILRLGAFVVSMSGTSKNFLTAGFFMAIP